MSKNEKNEAVEQAARSGSSDMKRKNKRGSGAVSIYSEVSITVKVDQVTNNFIKIVAGHERTSPSDREADLTATFKKAEAFNEAIVDRQAKRLKRLIRQIEAARE